MENAEKISSFGKIWGSCKNFPVTFLNNLIDFLSCKLILYFFQHFYRNCISICFSIIREAILIIKVQLPHFKILIRGMDCRFKNNTRFFVNYLIMEKNSIFLQIKQ